MGHADSEERLALVQRIIEKIPFNQLVQIHIDAHDPDGARMRFRMREELIGNYASGVLHGGVISTTLDVMGGVTVILGLLEQLGGQSPAALEQRFARMGTIDLRIDFLRPGRGREFVARGYLLRMGTRVAVTRTELHNERDELIAVGTVAYTIG